MTTATHNQHDTTTARVLFMACALRAKTWQLGCTTGQGQKPRERSVAARPQARVLQEVTQAKKRCGLPETAPVVRGYAAGRDGCWRHRFLQSQGITHPVVDSSSIAVNRRQRRAKSEALDVRKLLRMLRRYAQGEREVWRVVHGPTVAAEDGRHLHRDVETLKPARASTTTRITGLRSSQGGRLTSLGTLPEPLAALRLWDGSAMPTGLRRRVLRVGAPHELLSQQIAELEAERHTLLQRSQDASLAKGRQLLHLRGLGIHGAWGLVRACFAWRAWKNRRAVGGVAG
jgi:transposase